MTTYDEFIKDFVRRVQQCAMISNPNNWEDSVVDEVVIRRKWQRDHMIRTLVSEWGESKYSITGATKGWYVSSTAIETQRDIMSSFFWDEQVNEKILHPQMTEFMDMSHIEVEKSKQVIVDALVKLYNDYMYILRKYNGALYIQDRPVSLIDKARAICDIIAQQSRNNYSQDITEAAVEYAYEKLCGECAIDKEGLLRDVTLIVRSNYAEDSRILTVLPVDKDYLSFSVDLGNVEITAKVMNREISEEELSKLYPECLLYLYALKAVIKKNTVLK